MAVSVRQLGRISYKSCLALQKQLVQLYKTGNTSKVGELLVLEHNPVYTFGLREQTNPDMLKWLQSIGADVCKTHRGGLTTYHGPGQLVCYPILNLRSLKVGVREYINALEESMIAAVQKLGVEAHRSQHTGVWVRDEKLGAIGVQVSMGVTYHGLAINCSTDLSWYDHIVPCGIGDKGVTSLTQLLDREVPVSELSPHIVTSLCNSLGLHLEE